jgi:hypothetical protein
MYGRLLHLGVGLVTIGMLIGCHTTPPPHPPKDQRDPLFNSKKPIEDQPYDPAPEATVCVDPPPPPVPNQQDTAVVRQRVTLGSPQAGGD